MHLADPTLPRPFVITAWRTLHGQLGCNAFVHYVQSSIHSTPHSPLCSSPSCHASNRLETLTHIFFDCPDLSPVLPWLCNAWAALTCKAPPPLTAAVLLADDLRGWQTDSPADNPRLRALWTRLRVTVIGCIWRVRCLRDQGTTLGSSPARLAVSMAVSLIKEAIDRDWLRATSDIRQLDNGYFCSAWWRGRDPALPLSKFKQLWASPPILCGVIAGDPAAILPVPHSLTHHVGTDYPILFPP